MRHDHTNWLIHFVRDRVPEQDFPGNSEEESAFYAGGELGWDSDAFSVLRTIIRLGGLLPGYSFRSGKTTIYGGQPAVCATEMPLHAFATYARARGSHKNVSAYGVAFLKSEFFSAGGRPVLYGLSSNNLTYEKNEWSCRILSPEILPFQEQYRYVAYNPAGSKWLDWSHEREWRWKVQNEEQDYIWCEDGNGCIGPAPGLPLFRGIPEGAHFSKLCVIVWKAEEARQIQELLTGLYLAQSNNYGTPFSRSVIDATSIIVLDDVVRAVECDGNLDAQTIEGLEHANLTQPIILATPLAGTQQLVDIAMEAARATGVAAANEYMKTNSKDFGACGFADAVTYDVTHPVVQYLLAKKLASGPYDGCVVINVKCDWPGSQSIEYKEYIYRAVADCLTKQLGFKVYMNSRLD